MFSSLFETVAMIHRIDDDARDTKMVKGVSQVTPETWDTKKALYVRSILSLVNDYNPDIAVGT